MTFLSYIRYYEHTLSLSNMSNKPLILTICIFLLFCGASVITALVFYQKGNLDLKQDQTPSTQESSTRENTSSELVTDIQACQDTTLTTTNGNIYVTQNETERLLNNGLEANSDDFENGWVFEDAKLAFDCTTVIAHQRFNFTTGGGFNRIVHVFTLGNEHQSFGDGSTYISSENGEYVVVNQPGEEKGKQWLSSELLLTPILESDSIYVPRNRLGSVYYHDVITNEGSIILHADTGNIESGDWYVLAIDQDADVTVLDTFPHDLYFNFSSYDETYNIYSTGDCDPAQGSGAVSVLQCEMIKAYSTSEL